MNEVLKYDILDSWMQIACIPSQEILMANLTKRLPRKVSVKNDPVAADFLMNNQPYAFRHWMNYLKLVALSLKFKPESIC